MAKATASRGSSSSGRGGKGGARASGRSGAQRAAKSAGAASRRLATAGGRGGYAAVRRQINAQIESYRTLLAQLTGSTGGGAAGPTTVMRLARLVGQGARIYQVGQQQVARVMGQGGKAKSAAGLLRALRGRYGPAVKAVAPGKAGTWLVAAAGQVAGKPFRPNW